VITYRRMSEARAWNGESYDRISGPMEAMGRAVLDRLTLSGEETVLDAGCGSGRVTEALIERLPRGRVIAVDASESMIEAARERLGTRADVRKMDLLELELQTPVDAILSTATFHWIGDHERLFASLHAALRPGGQLIAQCGGEGNITILRAQANEVLAHEPYVTHFEGWTAPWNYASAEQSSERLQAAGFDEVNCWLAPAPAQPEHPREFLATIVLGPHVQQLPEQLREPFMDEVLERLGEPVIVDYVRLNIDARA
jgi:trans-aconitate 2-methyltransferase